jgi:hypothetical protein
LATCSNPGFADRSVRRFPLGGRGKFGHPDLAELGGFAWLIALHQQIQRRDGVTDRHVCIHTLCLAPGVGIDVADNHGMDDRPQGTQAFLDADNGLPGLGMMPFP